MTFRGMHGPLWTAIALLSVTTLAACGGGTTGVGGGSSGTGVGPVSGFGSVIVNGVRYSVDNTAFVDAHGRTLDNLAVGMVVKVIASRIDDASSPPAGVATKMEVERLADGPMDDNSVSIDNNTLRVMGQTVFVNLTTVFDNVADLSAVDNLVRQGKRPEIEVHGSTDDTGFLRASYIHLWSDNMVAGRGVQIRGTVRNLDTAGETFALGPLLQEVEYGAVVPVPSGLENGVFVEVKGTYRSTDNTILAGSITVADPASGQAPGDIAKAEGYVNRILADLGTAKRFELIAPDGMQVVNWSSATTAIGEGSASDVAPGARVQVEGKRNQDKTLAASGISFRKPVNIRIESTVTGKTSSSITLLGRTVTVNHLTSYRDRTGTFPGAFGLGDLNVNNAVRVDAFLDNTSSPGLPAKIVASRVELLDLDPIPFDRHILQGVIESKNTPSVGYMTMVGIPVQTFLDGRTTYLQVDGNDYPPGPVNPILQQANFFNALTVGQTAVKARGTFSLSILTASEVQIQPLTDK